VIYLLTELKTGEPKYVGSSRVGIDKRMMWHRGHTKSRHNPELAAWLAKGSYGYQEIAVVPDDEQFEAEARITREYRKQYDLFNVLDGTRHTPESIRRIKAGRQKRRDPLVA
jgi:hypothetical protein